MPIYEFQTKNGTFEVDSQNELTPSQLLSVASKYSNGQKQPEQPKAEPGVIDKLLSGLDKFTGKPARAGIRFAASKAADITQGTDLTKDRSYDELGKSFEAEEMKAFGKAAPVVATAGNMAADVTNVVPFGAVKGAVKGAAKGIGKTMGGYKKVASATTGLGKDVFEVASTKAGRAALEGAAGQQYAIGKKIESFLKDPWSYIPEKQVVDAAIPQMGNIPVNNVVKALNEAKVANAFTPEAKAANKAIDEMKAQIQGVKQLPASKILAPSGAPAIAAKTVKTQTEVPAEVALNIRRQVDRPINWDDPTDTFIGKAYLKVRMALADDLIQAAKNTGNEQYVKAMQGMKQKLSLIEKLQKKVGRNPESFVSNLFGANKTEAQNLIKELSQITGKDFLNEAEVASLAKQLGKDAGGKVPILPTHTTGKALLGTGLAGVGGTLAATLGLPAATATVPIAALTMSPAVATRAYGTGRALERGLTKAAPTIDKAAKGAWATGKAYQLGRNFEDEYNERKQQAYNRRLGR